MSRCHDAPPMPWMIKILFALVCVSLCSSCMTPRRGHSWYMPQEFKREAVEGTGLSFLWFAQTNEKAAQIERDTPSRKLTHAVSATYVYEGFESGVPSVVYVSAFLYNGCFRNVLDDWLSKADKKSGSEAVLLNESVPFMVQRRDTLVRVFGAEDNSRTFALVIHSERRRPEGNTPFFGEMIDHHNAYADKVFIDMVRSIQRNGVPVYMGGFTNVPVFDERNGLVVGYVNAEARAATWGPTKDWDILKK